MDVAPTEPSEGTEIDPDLVVGSMVGEYRVEGKLGQGGFGAVFKGTHPLIGKQVAIKVLSTRFSMDKEMVSRFQAEAKAVNQIRHRHIIDIFSFGTLEDRRCYYVMEYVDGEPLDKRVSRGPMGLPEALPILRAIARALDAAHAKGIAHRDLKAENVFLGRDADGAVFPKLLDFGIAKLMGEETAVAHKTRTGAPMGTPYYMSPEQTRGRNVDHRTDLYAFGVLVYLMLTSKYPLDGDDYVAILMRQVSDEPEPASTHVPGLPTRVDDVISWLMRKDADARPPDLMTAVRALEEVAGIVPSAADSASVTVPPMTPTRLPTAATQLVGVATRAPSSTDTPTRLRRSKVLPIVIALGVAATAGVAIFFATRGGSSPAGSGSAPLAHAGDAVSVPPPPDAAPEADASVAAVDAASRMVTITITGAPDGTPVKVGGEVIGTTPKVQLPRGSKTDSVYLVISADGFQPFTLPVTPDHDDTRPVKLRPARGGTRPPGTGTNGEPTDDIFDFPGKKKGSAPP